MVVITDEMLAEAAFEVSRAILDSLPDPKECDHVFSSAFERKMKKVIHKANHFVAYKVLRQVASIVIAFLIFASSVLVFNTEVRAEVINWVKEQLSEFYHYFFIGENEPEANSSYYPDWLPDGYTFIESAVLENGEICFYVKDSEPIIRFTYLRGSDENALFLSNNGHECRNVTIRGLPGELYIAKEETEVNAIAWEGEDGKVLFNIVADVPEDVLIKIAENVRIKK